MTGWLSGVDRSRQVKTHGSLRASYIVLHNTMGGSVTGSIDHLNGKTNGHGYHFLIERDGTVYQTAPIDRITRHAGLSNWRGWENLNSFSVGISFGNYGPLMRKGDSFFNEYGGRMKDADVMPGPIPHYNGSRKYAAAGWEAYSPAQITSGLRVCRDIVDRLPIRDVIRHDDIAVGRKYDTGPALSLAPFADLVGDRSAELVNRWRVVTPGDTLTVRDHHTHQGKALGALSDGAEIFVLSKAYYYRKGKARSGKWWLVSRDGFERTGFVSSDYLVFAEPYA